MAGRFLRLVNKMSNSTGSWVAGIYWINLMDHFTAGWGILVAAVIELIVLSWVYGVNRFIEDIEMMIGERSWLFWLWWRGCWSFVSPVLLLKIIAATKSTPDWGPYLIENRGERYDKTRYDKPNENTPQADAPEMEDS
ncbi:hypothetical protein scyTo_0016464 [Scyliorhinus torazame]|uniref:Uncharacterized protein n=1 Tax=Scyliorhinus torazame TaxID=75743 RepID=A0A401PRF0_SCYTO|nr:hypothetical protein [Scyliorhinus torazame]